jgi:hypothetical protein
LHLCINTNFPEGRSSMKQACYRADKFLALLSCILAAPPLSALSAAPNPHQYCAQMGNDDAPRAVPRSLAGPIRRLFGISGKYALETSYYRCAGGHVMLCTTGANLSCGKADTSTTLPAAGDWCRSNPNSDIPMVVTGHDTAFVWRCVGTVATAGDKIGTIDARGFFSENWKELK